MAKSITYRTLCGYNNHQINAHYFENLVKDIKYESTKFVNRISKAGTWKVNSEDNMKFDAVVGNPPYQESQENTSDSPVYHLFMDTCQSSVNLS